MISLSVPAETSMSMQDLSVDHATILLPNQTRSPLAGDFPAGLVAGPARGAPVRNFHEVFCRGCCEYAACRLLFAGSYTTAGMGQLETQLGRNQLDRHSWTGTSYSHETGSRPTGFSYVYKYLLVPSRIDSNKQCFHNQYMHTCLLRATIGSRSIS